MVEQTSSGSQNTTAGKTGLVALLEQYKEVTPSAQSVTTEAFEARIVPEMAEYRISGAPQTISHQILSTGEIRGQMTLINRRLFRLLRRREKLGAELKGLVKKDNPYTFRETVKIKYLEWRGKEEEADGLAFTASQRHGLTLDRLCDEIGKVVDEEHQNSVRALAYAQGVRVETVKYMIDMDRAWIQRLASSYRGTGDLTKVDQEIKKLSTEIEALNEGLKAHETLVQQAKEASNVDRAYQLTQEMLKALDVKQRLLEGKVAKDGHASDIRRKILDSAIGIESAKGAIADAQMSYAMTNLWIDSLNKQESKYRYAKSDFVRGLKIKGKIGAGQLKDLDRAEVLTELIDVSNMLIEANLHISMRLSENVDKLAKTPFYDENRIRAFNDTVVQYTDKMRENDLKWAELQQRVSSVPTQSHYTSHQ